MDELVWVTEPTPERYQNLRWQEASASGDFNHGPKLRVGVVNRLTDLAGLKIQQPYYEVAFEINDVVVTLPPAFAKILAVQIADYAKVSERLSQKPLDAA